ncbi:LAMI_0F07866g1_1 [Lachancea mirantina]|uniref:LAMI_0F07866g1_1 n=1 Tax=Lachancea mirantina TaxID=1230905 RepID=A0A1G4JZY4_9SACH|nr:LAMI_0F07866g1_1 [Lachancea mirantina]
MARDKSVTWKKVDPDTVDLKSCKAAIVGGTGGLGRALARYLVSRGAVVTVVGQTFRDADIKGLSFIKADLGLVSEAKRIASELPAEELDLVVFTTGIIAAPARQVTSEGIEKDMAVSYLSRYVILRGIADRLGKGRLSDTALARPRVFITGYPGANNLGDPEDLNADKKPYKAFGAHMNTVAANEALTLDSAQRYPGLNIFGLNPGLVKTNIRDNFLGQNSWKSSIVEFFVGWLCQSPEAYARNIGPLLVTPELESKSGAIFDNKGNAILASQGFTKELTGKFMQSTEKLLEEHGN